MLAALQAASVAILLAGAAVALAVAVRAAGGGPAPARPAWEERMAAPAAAVPDRRASVRAAAVRPALVRRAGPGAEPMRSFAVEVSEHGVLLAGPADLAVGDELWISVDLGDDRPPLSGPARVARETGAGYKAVALDPTSG